MRGSPERLDPRFRDSRFDRCAIVILAIAVGIVFGSPPTHAWQATVHGELGGNGDAVAIDASGDAFAAGTFANEPVLPEYGFASSLRLAVVKFSGGDGTELWRRDIGPPGVGNEAKAVAVNAAGNVFAAGRTGVLEGDLAVVALDGSDGSYLWSFAIGGTAGLDDVARAIAIDGSSDVIAGGMVANTGTMGDFYVTKLRGTDGSELWHQTINGTANGEDFVAALAVDAAGDVFVAGSIVNTGTSVDFGVAKLRGGDGAVLWQQALNGSANAIDRGWAIAVDGAGDAAAVGYVDTAGDSLDIAVVKLRGSDGAILWQQAFDGGASSMDEGLAVAIDSAGDIVAAGSSVPFGGGAIFSTDFTVIKIAGADGSEQWRTTINGVSLGGVNDIAHAVAVDGNDDVFAAGSTQGPETYDDFTVVKLTGASGGEVWRRTIKGATPYDYYEKATALAVDASGHAVAVGQVGAELGFSAMAVLAVREEVAGHSLGISDRGDPKRRRLVLLSKETGVIGSGPGGPADLTIGGATLELFNPVSGEVDEIPLPAENWAAWPPGGNSTTVPQAFVYRDSQRAAGPCNKVLVGGDGTLKATCRGGEIDFTLDEPSQGALAVNLRAATGAILHCMLFGGTIGRDTPGIFKARAAEAPAACLQP